MNQFIPQTTKIIAEIGVNHNGDIELAKKMVESAKDAGADTVKFQTFQATRLASASTPKVAYQVDKGAAGEGQIEMLKKLELSQPEFQELKRYCDKIGIEFCSTPFSKEDAIFLCSLGVSTIKVASPDIIDRTLHEFLATTDKKIILSSGMSTHEEIAATLSLYDKGSRESRLSLLLCTSAYPTNPIDVHLKSLSTLQSTFRIPVGLSDHTAENYAAFAAVALGAVIIEKHFTLDRGLPGPDQAASSTPEDFAELVKGIRVIELALGTANKGIVPAEEESRKISRKSIFAAHNLSKGHTLTEQDFSYQRPGTGISPMQYRELLGRQVNIKIDKGSPILWEHLEK